MEAPPARFPKLLQKPTNAEHWPVPAERVHERGEAEQHGEPVPQLPHLDRRPAAHRQQPTAPTRLNSFGDASSGQKPAESPREPALSAAQPSTACTNFLRSLSRKLQADSHLIFQQRAGLTHVVAVHPLPSGLSHLILLRDYKRRRKAERRLRSVERHLGHLNQTQF